MNEKSGKKYIELSSTKIMLIIPEDAVEVDVECAVYQDGIIQKVTQHLDLSDIRKAMKDADENYIDPDAEYVLTEKGKEYANQPLKESN